MLALTKQTMFNRDVLMCQPARLPQRNYISLLTISGISEVTSLVRRYSACLALSENSWITAPNKRINSDPKSWRFLSRLFATICAGKFMKSNRVLSTLILLLFSLITALAQAIEYECIVHKKFNSEMKYTDKQIEEGRFSVIIKDIGKKASLSRCSFVQSQYRVTCDSYEVDKIAYDEHVKIKKYYVFRSQFDVQLFNNMTFIENNGRGGIAFGKCQVISP